MYLVLMYIVFYHDLFKCHMAIKVFWRNWWGNWPVV